MGSMHRSFNCETRGHQQHEELEKNADVVSLLESIQKICLDYDNKISPDITLHKHIAAFYNYKQKDDDNVHQYLELFKHLVQNITRYGWSIGKHPLLIKESMIKDNALTENSSNKDFQTAYAKLTGEKRDKYINKPKINPLPLRS